MFVTADTWLEVVFDEYHPADCMMGIVFALSRSKLMQHSNNCGINDTSRYVVVLDPSQDKRTLALCSQASWSGL